MLLLRLPDEAASSGDAFDATFNDEYGISVDQFVELRDEADATATVQFGEALSVGE